MTQELTLMFARAGSLAAPAPVLADPRTQVWKDAGGADAAYFYIVDSEYWAWMRCIGTFQIRTNGEILVEALACLGEVDAERVELAPSVALPETHEEAPLAQVVENDDLLDDANIADNAASSPVTVVAERCAS